MAREIDMRHGIRHARVPLISKHRLAGECLKGGGGHEMGCPFGHRHLHVGTLLTEQAEQLCRLIGGNTAGDTENDALSL